MLPDNGNADITETAWIVNMVEADNETSFHVTVQATSEQGAIIEAEEKFGEDGCYAISAYPKPHHTPRCPICGGLNCKNPHAY